MVAQSPVEAAQLHRPWVWQLTSIAGIPLMVQASALLTLGLVTCSYSWRWQPLHPDWGLIQLWSTSLITAFLLFGSVCWHELAHSLVARHQGIPVRSITLFLLGGLATIEREARTRPELVQLALAGPGASLLLALGLGGLSQILPEGIALPARQLATVNAILGGFNLLPLLPLDGGHVFAALVWKWTGDRLQGVQVAARLGQVLGGAALGGGLAWFIGQNDGFGGWIALIGGFIFRNAGRYQALARLQKILLTMTVADVPTRPWQVIDADTTVEVFVQEYLSAELSAASPQVVLRTQSGDVLTWSGLDLERLQGLERSLWGSTTLATFRQDLLVLSSQLSLSAAILRLDAHPEGQALIWRDSSSGPSLDLSARIIKPEEIQGWIDAGALLATVGSALEITIPESDLEQTRQTGIYPPLLQLKAVAEALDWMHGTPAQNPLLP